MTFWDSYATRSDALHENQQRVAADLTNRDLKLTPPPGLAEPDLAKWLTLATVQSVDDSVGRVLAFLDKAGLARNTMVVYTSDVLIVALFTWPLVAQERSPLVNSRGEDR